VRYAPFGKPRREEPTRPCAYERCRKPFKPRTSHPTQRYCCRACMFADGAIRKAMAAKKAARP